MLTNLYRSGKCSLYGPASIQATVQGILADANLFRPSGHAHRFVVVRQHSICALIAALFLACRPAAVLLGVTQIVVDSVQAVFVRWPLSHILQKHPKELPFVADRDASPTVIGVRFVGWTVASSTHGTPRPPFRGAFHAVFCLSAFEARLTPAISQTHGIDRLFRSTFAAAKPSSTSAFGNRMKLKNRPATKLLAGKVYEAWAAAGRMLSSHLSLLSRFEWIGPARSYDLLVGPFHYSITFGA